MFSQSDAYDHFMGRWTRRLAPQLLDFAGVRDRDRVLDVGSGTGELALAIAGASSAQVIGVDPSLAYVVGARARAETNRLRFVVGNAQQLPIADDMFDRSLSLAVMNFIPDPAAALTEMIRVTRPAGVVAAAVWDYAEGMQMLRTFWDEAGGADPAIAARDERNMPLCRQGELSRLWRAHGLLQIEERPLVIPLAFASFDDYWSPFLGGQGPAGAYVASLAETGREALRQRLRRRLLHDDADRPITLQARAWTVKGDKKDDEGGPIV